MCWAITCLGLFVAIAYPSQPLSHVHCESNEIVRNIISQKIQLKEKPLPVHFNKTSLINQSLFKADIYNGKPLKWNECRKNFHKEATFYWTCTERRIKLRIFFFSLPIACRSSQARDQTHTTAIMALSHSSDGTEVSTTRPPGISETL